MRTSIAPQYDMAEIELHARRLRANQMRLLGRSIKAFVTRLVTSRPVAAQTAS